MCNCHVTSNHRQAITADNAHELSLALRRDEDDEDKVVFRGWARMALPTDSFSVVEVRKPNVGEAKPAAVTAEIVINPGRAHPACCAQHPQPQSRVQMVYL